MRVYRGPSSKPFYDDAHECVSRILPDQLENGIRSNACIRFNITKNSLERQAICTVLFEEEDIIPMIGGLLERLKISPKCAAEICSSLADTKLSNAQKLQHVQIALATKSDD